jgi:hypothetical protein
LGNFLSLNAKVLGVNDLFSKAPFWAIFKQIERFISQNVWSHCLAVLLNFRTMVKRRKVLVRVARFFLVQKTKTGENLPEDHKIYQMAKNYTKWPKIIPNGQKLYQTAKNYTKWPAK